jgi:multiple sugar transport system substrate-binding protein
MRLSRDLPEDPGSALTTKNTVRRYPVDTTLTCKRILSITVFPVLFLGLICPVFSEGQREGGPVTLTYWVYSDPNTNPLEEELIERYMADNPDVEVEMSVPGTTPDLNKKLLISLAGDAPPDSFNTYHGFFPQIAYRNQVDPVDLEVFGANSYDQLEEGWMPGSMRGWKWGEKLYGIPSSLSTYGMFINAGHFRDAGLDPDRNYPRTWDEGDDSIAQLGRKLVQTDGTNITRQAFGMSGYAVVLNIVYQAQIRQLGGSIIGPDGRSSTINSPAGVRALTTYFDFVHKYKISAPTGEKLQNPGFDTGDTSIVVEGGPWFYTHLRESSPTIFQDGDGVRVYPFPRYKDGEDVPCPNYGYAYHVAAASENQREAWELINHLSSFPELHLERAGQIQTRKGWENSQPAKEFPYFDVWMKELGGGTAYMEDPLNEAVYKAMSLSIFDAVAPKEALDRVKPEIDKYLQELPYKTEAAF